MPQSKVLEGCCASRFFYNLGECHGHDAPITQKAFDDYIKRAGYAQVNIAITSKDQQKVRKYLSTQGWEHKDVGGLWIHTIDYISLRNYLNSVKYPKMELTLSNKTSKFAKNTYTGPVFNLRNRVTYDLVADHVRRINEYAGYINFSDQQQLELKNRLENYFRIILPENYHDRYPTIRDLRDYIGRKISDRRMMEGIW